MMKPVQKHKEDLPWLYTKHCHKARHSLVSMTMMCSLPCPYVYAALHWHRYGSVGL
jgi:hypothetical protein